MSEVVVPPVGGELSAFEQEMAQYANEVAKTEASTGSGNFFSLRAGQLAFNGQPMPGNEMAVVIVDYIFENVYYEGEWDPDDVRPPRCFSFSREGYDMTPHESVVKAGHAQNDRCEASGEPLCKWNKFNSADKGRGKACRNTRRLALIPAGTAVPNERPGTYIYFTDPAQFADSPVGFLRLPVTSVKNWGMYAKSAAGALRRPYFGISTRVMVFPDKDTQVRVEFKPIDVLSEDIVRVVMRRKAEVAPIIESPYGISSERAADGEASPPPAKNKKSARY
jgi:hypothetical protein